MSAPNKSFKDLILKSSLPLEYESKINFESLGYKVNTDFSYLRLNSNGEELDFSFDLLSTKKINDVKVKLLVECKYVSEGIRWVFMPALNKVVNPRFLLSTFLDLKDDYIDPIGLLSSKGVEIGNADCKDITITKAINQISYGFSRVILDDYHQFFDKKVALVGVIVTTADLFVLNKDISIDKIKASNDDNIVNSLCTSTDFITLNLSNSYELMKYNEKMYLDFVNEGGSDLLMHRMNIGLDFDSKKKSLSELNSEEKQFLNFFKYLPRFLIIMNHGSESYKKLDQFLEEKMVLSEEESQD